MTMRQRSWSSAASEAASKREEEAANPLLSEGAGYRIGQSTDADDSSRTGLRAIIMLQGKPFFFLIFTWILFILYILNPSSPLSTSSTTEINDVPDVPRLRQNHTESKNPPANFHLVIPASKADVNLCKVMVSAGILGYPDPVIVNWGENFDDKKYVEGGSHLAKVTGIAKHFNRFNDTSDDDIVLMVDGYDIWLQLKPQTLIDRYFSINKRADERIAREIGDAAREHNIHQEIIFGCQKRCWPWTEKDPPCYAVPFSDLPEDVYGPETDTDIGFKENPYVKFRPRFINSGVAIGTVKAMRKMFNQALELLTNDPREGNMGSDQYIFSHILGDQEVWREALRQDSRNNLQKMKEKLKGGYEPLHPFVPSHIEEVRKKAANRPDKNWEFGIGLDYRMEIGLNTVFSEDDTAWLHWANRTELQLAEQRENISASHPHGVASKTLAKDIADTVPPFWTFNHDPKFPRWKKWTEVPLFTNIWSGIVPAVIHHNAHRDERKALRETWWNETWYANYTRSLYDAHIWEPIVPVAYSGYSQETLREYWPAERWRGGGRNGPHIDSPEQWRRWVRFDDICRPYHEEVFRDGQGEWILPDVH
ncbi:hypothetical protein Slin15195_G120960 [Septoria linicola]|uniref:Uncharacterized protein n=1 Tax=Septoria linicola TaxID=215465 RepID=A0A9Q9AZC3_9PEZI|nr:hypothetical protein Slin15195_G120960 [Septoria linicola]